jgi:quercetin dioxygenase-like cupin family protein
MRTVLVVTLVMSGWLGYAQELPHAFPRDGAVQVVDNDRVTIWDVTWNKGKPTPMHRHRYDLIAVFLVGSAIKVTMPDGTSRENVIDPGFILFQPAGVTHIEEGVVESNPRHAILIDLKSATVGAAANNSSYPAAFPRDSARKAIDNEKVVVWEYAWKPGVPVPMHFHDKDSVVVFMSDGELKSTAPDGKSDTIKVTRGMTRFSPRGGIHAEELLSGDVRAVITELK